MKIAFASYKYSPYGGLERDMLRMAECAAKRGHEVVIFTGEWNGPELAVQGIRVELIEVEAISNHARALEFSEKFINLVKYQDFDVKVAFNRIPDCDFYFAADNCYAAEMPKKHSRLILSLLPRYKTYLQMEKDVFDVSSKTKIMYISAHQKADYQNAYGTPDERFVYLPPGMNPECKRPENAESVRNAKRAELGLAPDTRMLLLVGSNFRQKGGDRAIEALAALPAELKRSAKLFFAGNSPEKFCLGAAAASGVEDNVVCLGARTDVPALLLASDILLLPARNEATGTVLVEAISSGVPVMCSGECGFGNFVTEACGYVAPEPWDQKIFNAALERFVSESDQLRKYAVRYSDSVDFTRRADVAVDYLESFTAK